jgi:hypothetical protein
MAANAPDFLIKSLLAVDNSPVLISVKVFIIGYTDFGRKMDCEVT